MKKVKQVIIAGAIVAIAIGIGLNGVLSLKPIDDTQQSNGEEMLIHIHPRLYLYMDGKPYLIPQKVGIDSNLWKDHSLAQYGMKGMAPIHTHTGDGMLHVESKVIRNYTLGEFLNIWGVDLKGDTVTSTSFGEPISDWQNYVLKDADDIIMNITSSR